MPTEFAGALAKRVLQPQALLIAHHLVGCRLADVDHSLARQMDWLDQFGSHERSPPELRRRRRRSDAEEPAAASPKDLPDYPLFSATESLVRGREFHPVS